MQRKFILIYFLIFASLLFIMSLSRPISDKVRGKSLSLLAPILAKGDQFKGFLHRFFRPSVYQEKEKREEIERLLVENQLLEIEIASLQERWEEQQLLLSQLLPLVPAISEGEKESKDLLEEKKQAMVLNQRLQALPAHVFFRSFDLTSPYLWIDLGEATNRLMGEVCVGKNSPVVIGKSAFGVVDWIEEAQSRVRLISDAKLFLSVRAVRGGKQDFLLSEQVEGVLQKIEAREGTALSKEERGALARLLRKLRQTLLPLKKTWALAKGMINGGMLSSEKSGTLLLKGVGFNLEFADEEGVKRDLRRGKAVASPGDEVPILKVGDLLVTTGMDGIFPAGFQVGSVTTIHPLQEGDYTYEIEAEPSIPLLGDYSLVFVLPPLNQSER